MEMYYLTDLNFCGHYMIFRDVRDIFRTKVVELLQYFIAKH